jgi:hypothetical protein
MVRKRFIQLTELTTPSGSDYLPIADTSANQDKFISVTNLFTGAPLPDGFVDTDQLSDELARGYNRLAVAPTTITYNGNRSYSLTFPLVDYASVLSVAMRMKFVRAATAPTRCTSLNGTTQYWVKTSPNKMTFTDDFVISAWIKLSSYAAGNIVSRYNATSGWRFSVDATGVLTLYGYNGSGANYSGVISSQALPLNEWVHVAALLDMSAFTAAAATAETAKSWIMIDGVEVPATVARGGTNPTALVQAGNLEIGSANATTFLGGKVAQAAIYNTRVTQANIRATISQGLTGSETGLSSAYSFDNSVTDLNTTTPNNLSVGGGSVLATSADSPFSNGAELSSGYTAGTTDFGIVASKPTFSTNTSVTVQVPKGCTIPTTGGVSLAYYSLQEAPYGFPASPDKWRLNCLMNGTGATLNSGSLAAGAIGNFNLLNVNVPIGAWNVGYNVSGQQNPASGNNSTYSLALSTSSSTITDVDTQRGAGLALGVAISSFAGQIGCTKPVLLTNMTPYYLVTKNSLSVAGNTYVGLVTTDTLFADFAYL